MKILTGIHSRLLDAGILLLRISTGVILFVAGAGKVMGWFGGMGLKASIASFAAGHFSAPWAYISCFTEFLGGLLLVIGLLTRPAAFLLFINMLVATITVGTKGFFMGGGAYPASLMISSLVILLTGPLAYSLDYLLFGRKFLR